MIHESGQLENLIPTRSTPKILRCSTVYKKLEIHLSGGKRTAKGWKSTLFQQKDTPEKFNSEFTPKKWWLEDEDDRLSYWVSVTFQGRTVKLWEGNTSRY